MFIYFFVHLIQTFIVFKYVILWKIFEVFVISCIFVSKYITSQKSYETCGKKGIFFEVTF